MQLIISCVGHFCIFYIHNICDIYDVESNKCESYQTLQMRGNLSLWKWTGKNVQIESNICCIEQFTST